MTAIHENLYTIQKMPESERPRERFIKFGAESLSAAELIAIVLGSGTKRGACIATRAVDTFQIWRSPTTRRSNYSRALPNQRDWNGKSYPIKSSL